MIIAENLVHLYKEGSAQEIRALDKVNLKIEQGEFVAIIGHNGSGKSTLAKHFNGLLLPSAGKVEINGQNTADRDKIWEIRREVGMVFQNPDNQLVATIVEEDVAFGPENLGLAPGVIRSRVDQALEVVGMGEMKKKEPHHLSGGQKQRVAIAGILAMKPSCLVLDEPTAMLDPRGRREVMETITSLNKEEGLTIIHITHFMEETVNADRVMVMEKGRIVMEGSPREIFKQVKELKQLRMDVPQMTELAYRLRLDGFQIPAETLTVDEMVKSLCL